MSLDIVVSARGVRLPLARARVETLAQGVLRAERVRDAFISVAFVSRREIARMNRKHLGHAGATDVISFALSGAGRTMGDIYIAPEVARDNAVSLGVPVREEMARLVVHGMLHVLGHDHPDGEERVRSPMWKRQERLLARLIAL